VRRLVWCGPTPPPSDNPNVFFMPDVDGESAARDIMASLTTEFTSAVGNAVEGLKGEPISMVPGGGGGLTLLPRSGNTPNPAEGSSTPASVQSPNSSLSARENETQVCGSVAPR
jgi:hypothetical protein